MHSVITTALRWVGYNAIPAMLGVGSAFFGLRDPTFCASLPIACALPPAGGGLYALFASAFMLFRACIDLSALTYKLVRLGESSVGDLKHRFVLAVSHTVFSAGVLLSYLLLVGIQIA